MNKPYHISSAMRKHLEKRMLNQLKQELFFSAFFLPEPKQTWLDKAMVFLKLKEPPKPANPMPENKGQTITFRRYKPFKAEVPDEI